MKINKASRTTVTIIATIAMMVTIVSAYSAWTMINWHGNIITVNVDAFETLAYAQAGTPELTDVQLGNLTINNPKYVTIWIKNTGTETVKLNMTYTTASQVTVSWDAELDQLIAGQIEAVNFTVTPIAGSGLFTVAVTITGETLT